MPNLTPEQEREAKKLLRMMEGFPADDATEEKSPWLALGILFVIVLAILIYAWIFTSGPVWAQVGAAAWIVFVILTVIWKRIRSTSKG